MLQHINVCITKCKQLYYNDFAKPNTHLSLLKLLPYHIASSTEAKPLF